MDLKNKAKEAAKNIEGKVQETVGDLTGNQEAQIKGKAKQIEVKIHEQIEELKDNVTEIID
ncbi:CsbD family protein [Haemophilus parainfluenzae]|uniref:CsbD family protein n=1 Tax=Haemophilus parainfluenzae TaxID=729 RepID=UPI00124B0AA8|nr:CsbD family protein [Haemophilus parainfluenzae]KAB1991085.1 CsbD family protein [Haemophilus parainfluenzae]